MIAIPSPDLVLNLVASAGQALGLATLVVGRLLWTRRGRTDDDFAGAGRLRRQRRLTLLFAVLFALSGTALLFQHLGAVDAHNRRLRANLVRPSVEGGRAVGDASLKTLSFSGQLEHPRGIDAGALESLLAAGASVVDVREPEEVETGRVAGSWHARYPDLLADASRLEDEGPVVLLCHSGNRSSELADELARRGLDARFLVGGYEKWIAEDRPLEGATERGELRSIPDYPGRLTLLDTPDVVRLVEQERALFVDVRYPEDLERHALPDAVNLPLRRMPSEAMWAALEALPDDRPIVVPCYDKRSSFYGEVLGLRLTRLGKDFRGRYTVPHEYVRPAKEREHVVAWHEARRGRSLLALVSEPLVALLGRVRADVTGGSLALAIVAVVLALRLLLLPLTSKADRDQAVARRLKPALAALRARLADDPRRAARAVHARQRAAGLTPLRNLVGSTAQIVLFAALFAAVDRAARGSTEALLWIPALGGPDPLFVLPVLTGVLGAALVLAGGRATRGKLALALAFGAGLVALCAWLRAAVGLYLVLNLALVLVQGALVRRRLARAEASHEDVLPARPAGALVPLALADTLPAAGGKAARLAQLARLGLPVPPGFVLDEGAESAPDAELLFDMFDALGAERVAVRSSGADEDGADRSYAGVFETVLDVGRGDLLDALAHVRASLSSQRARAYGGGDGDAGSIVVQAMVPARFAGVVFTEDPGCTGAMLIELVEGLGDALVSGMATPRTFRLGRHTGRVLAGDEPPLDLAPLVALARRVEVRFGRPQDIEWAWDERGFHLLQARDVTVTATEGGERTALEHERRRLLAACTDADADEVVLEQDELSELLPAPTTLSLALMRALWEPGGTVDLACRATGVPYDVDEDAPPLVASAFGRVFRDVREARRRQGRGLGLLAAFQLARGADDVEARFHRRAEALRAELRLRDALDLGRLSLADLVTETRATWERFVTRTYVEAERVNIAADYYLTTARERLVRAGLDPAEVLAHLPETVVHRAHALLADASLPLDEAVEQYVTLYGHRATHDFELAEPRVRADHAAVRARAERLRTQPAAAPSSTPTTPPLGRVLALQVERARRFQALKEEAKHEALRELAHLTELLAALGERVGLGALVFELEPAEVRELAALDPARLVPLRRIATERRARRQALAALDVPSTLTPAVLETLAAPGLRAVETTDGALAGSRVAGAGVRCGRARVLDDASRQDELRPGEVLVVRTTDPDWMPSFGRAGGLVAEVGGWLSHAAIQAREHGLPAIVGCRGALARIATGDLVQLGTDGRVDVLPERREHERVATTLPARLRAGDRLLPVRVVDLSRGGVRLQPLGPHAPLELERGEPVALQLEDGPWHAARIVSTSPAHAGLRLDVPLEFASQAVVGL